MVGLFLLMSILTVKFGDRLKDIVFIQGTAGVGLYILVSLLGSVTPLSTMPLLPVAVALWGNLAAAIFSIIGWWLGAMLAFSLSRWFGKPLIAKIVALEEIRRIEKIIPAKNIFLSIVILRIVLPVDVLSFGLGLFSPVSWGVYALATLVGIIPFAFILSYFLVIPLVWQLLMAGMAVATLGLAYWRWRKL